MTRLWMLGLGLIAVLTGCGTTAEQDRTAGDTTRGGTCMDDGEAAPTVGPDGRVQRACAFFTPPEPGAEEPEVIYNGSYLPLKGHAWSPAGATAGETPAASAPSEAAADAAESQQLARLASALGVEVVPWRAAAGHASLVVVTDYSDPNAWASISRGLLAPTPEGFTADFEAVTDGRLADLSEAEVKERLSEGGYARSYAFIADAATFTQAEHPVLVVDLANTHRSFRASQSGFQAVENNLSIANMDFAEFADAVDADGVFRGF